LLSDLVDVEKSLRLALLHAEQFGILPEEEWILKALAIHTHIVMRKAGQPLEISEQNWGLRGECPEFIDMMGHYIFKFGENCCGSNTYQTLIGNIYKGLYFLPAHNETLQEHNNSVSGEVYEMTPGPEFARIETFTTAMAMIGRNHGLCEVEPVRN
jgi:hypothetical protein